MFSLIGSSHRSAPVAIRERLAISKDLLPEALERLRSRDGIHEAMIVSTCNRVEILVRARDARAGYEAILGFLSGEQGLTREELDRYTYRMHDREAVEHLFQVASGLDSMILGEPQILGQVRQAWRTAQAAGTTGTQLDRLLQSCLTAAKRVRTETGISRNAVSVAYAAAQLGRNIFGKLEGRRALLVGAGKMSFLVAKHLVANGLTEIIVASRSYNHAVEMAERAGGRAVHWDDGLAQLAAVDIVVSCTDSSHYVLTRKDVAQALRARRGEPLFLIDIAVPRDIEPAVNELDNAYLYDIDGLQGVVDTNLEERKKAAEHAQALIADEAGAFMRWRQAQRVTPLIVALRETLNGIGERELERVRHKVHGLTPEQEAALEQLTHGILQKVLHRPILHLRGAVERGDVERCAAIYDALFGIGAAAVEAVTQSPPAAVPAEETEPDDDPARRIGPQRVVKGGKDA